MEKVKEKDKAVVNYTNITPPKEIKKTPTVKERINTVVDKYEDKVELKKQIFQLVQQILHPEQFCPQCDERMFFDATTASYSCPNCGYVAKLTTTTTTIPIIRPTGKVPPQIENIISQANKDMKETLLPRPKTALGDKIRKLVDQRDSGMTGAPTKEDEARIKGSDKNVSNKINWV